jgi:hypothetical protein
MSNILHMDIEQARAVAQQIKHSSHEIEEQALSVLNSVQRIDWQGPDRDAYLAHMKVLIRQLRAQAQAGINLAQRADLEADEWEAADQKSSASWKEISAAAVTASTVPLFTSLPATGSDGTVLGENTSVDEVNDYVDDRYINDPSIQDSPYLDEAVKRVGKQYAGESDNHYQWRIKKEIDYLRALSTYYWQNSSSSISPPPLNGIINFGLWLVEWNFANKYKAEKYPKWLEMNPEPK